MKFKRRPENGFNMSFLDVMACGLGAVILIFILVDFKAFTADPNDESQNIEQELAGIENETARVAKSIDEINDKIAKQTSKQDDSEQSTQDTTQKQNKMLQSISTEIAIVADLENQLAGVSKRVDDSSVIAMSGKGEQNFITGMKVEGEQIGLLIDKSASMMGDNLLEVLGKLGVSDSQKVSSAKWIRTKRVAQWLIARLPDKSKVTMVVYSDDAKRLGTGNVSSAAVGDAMDAILKELGNVVPNGGTNLELGLKTLFDANPSLTDVYVVTDGLPTLGGVLPLKCRNFISSSQSISSECRKSLFISTVSQIPGNIRVNVILLPIEGDPFASSMYWNWTRSSYGVFLSPAAEWP
jgi:hypothetical protein